MPGEMAINLLIGFQIDSKLTYDVIFNHKKWRIWWVLESTCLKLKKEMLFFLLYSLQPKYCLRSSLNGKKIGLFWANLNTCFVKP